ncbi:hypothetical protein [Mucilaginibacter jinjuensis]|uniref:Uncharacterized protein n=1 Tax=Mucilaginibacter jinjuensis TaxID=1176721 RepID=A0ABY7TAT6_9SPHI|nr:hypothetical protein [Mucilaginibacter jinjuensis]WCT13428.1 hypothetical protein PQO05_05705 [Mucilaginibacter jinjuensis]
MEVNDSTGLYETLQEALAEAEQRENWLESHVKSLRYVNMMNEQLQQAVLLTDRDLPASMDRLISTLDLQSSFNPWTGMSEAWRCRLCD